MQNQNDITHMTMQTLSDMTVIKLKQLCRDHQFHGFSSYKKKKDLVQFIYDMIQLEKPEPEPEQKLKITDRIIFENKIKITIDTDIDIDEDTTKNIIQQLYQRATIHGIPITDMILNKDHIYYINDKNKVCFYMHEQQFIEYTIYWVFNKDTYSFIIKIYQS